MYRKIEGRIQRSQCINLTTATYEFNYFLISAQDTNHKVNAKYLPQYKSTKNKILQIFKPSKSRKSFHFSHVLQNYTWPTKRLAMKETLQIPRTNPKHEKTQIKASKKKKILITLTFWMISFPVIVQEIYEEIINLLYIYK